MDQPLLPIDNHEVNKQLRKELKKGFIRKVLGIVTAQLCFTFLVCFWIYKTESVKKYMQENFWPIIVALVVYFVFAIALICCKEVARKVPTNYIFLTIFTLAVSVMVGFIVSYYDPDVVIQAVILTIIASVTITAYALTYKVKMQFLIGLILLCAVMSLVTLILVLITGSGGLIKLYLFIGVVFYGLFLMFDVKRLASKKYGLSHEDYVFGAMMIYLDIINLFLEILRLLGKK